MQKLIDGRFVSKKLRDELKKEIEKLNIKPCLAVILVGDNPASNVYVNMKIKKAYEVGIKSIKKTLNNEVSETELLNIIQEFNENIEINGILVQLPLPKHINQNKVFQKISSKKDVDGINPENIGKNIISTSSFEPCTPLGIMKLLKHYQIDLEGMNVVIVGRSLIVGTPLIHMFLKKNATVTICHSKTKNLQQKTLNADLIVLAVGRKNILTEEMVKQDVIIIDVGINKYEGKLYGDADFENLKNKVKLITPVPGGVGPMTIACLLENTLKAYKLQKKEN